MIVHENAQMVALVTQVSHHTAVGGRLDIAVVVFEEVEAVAQGQRTACKDCVDPSMPPEYVGLEQKMSEMVFYRAGIDTVAVVDNDTAARSPVDVDLRAKMGSN